jgi:hypothetical protein
MTKLRKAVMAMAVAAGTTGCAHLPEIPPSHWSIFHCSECDDFPTPAYGPGFTQTPGTYTGQPGTGPSIREEMPTSSGVPNPTPPGLNPNTPPEVPSAPGANPTP